ncbi:MAG TPA: c-type cytochrome [Acidobacteriaceae bacterium]|nr:c-type cytochrome [Acidobacteriaceae bacterium]
MRKRSEFVTALVFAGLGIGISALAARPAIAQGAAPPATSSVDKAAADRGEGDFSSSCSFCHGSQATGTEQAPNLLRSPIVFQDHNGDTLGPFLKQGRPTLGMPAFPSLPPEQVQDISAFLHARIQQVRGKRMPETALLVGDPKAGLAFFNGAGKCSTCHSPTGDLAHIGSKDQPLALTTSFLTPPAKPLQVTVVSPSGETVKGKLDYLDEFVVSLTDSDGNYHTWPRDQVKSVDVMDPLAAHKALLRMYSDKEIHDLLAYLVTLK